MNALLMALLLSVQEPVIVDLTGDLEDAFALGLILNSPELDVKGITISGGDVAARGRLVCRMLTAIGRKGIPVATGLSPEGAKGLGSLHPYSGHPDALYNRTQKPVKQGAVAFLADQLKGRPGEITVVCLGPTTNLEQLLKDHPDAKPKRVVVSVEAAGALKDGLVLAVSVPEPMRLTKGFRAHVFEARTPLTRQLQSMDQMVREEAPKLSNLAQVAALVIPSFFTIENGRAVLADAESLLCWAAERLASGRDEAPKSRPAPVNVSTLVARGGMPNRVHAWEDFETDIERRWWMSGVAETKNVPPGGGRACRGVLTHDFDDLQGQKYKEMYTAVIFNPVPGPPMGKRPRLSFRYWLRGTDTLRVAIYSLSNGYHRHLMLTGLPQGRWEEGAVDMTACRRPDGSGGPLSEGERIDDIQFYADADAELLIDDIVLYDGAAADETRPFPARIHYTGVFDTGKQGKEWPGTFDIVPSGFPPTAKAAKSVPSAELGSPWIRLHLRGERVLGESPTLFFRHRLKGADTLRVAILDQTVELKRLSPEEWAPATASFTGLRPGLRADEVRLIVPPGGELLVDDVLLYER
jgi:hypothetical protein